MSNPAQACGRLCVFLSDGFQADQSTPAAPVEEIRRVEAELRDETAVVVFVRNFFESRKSDPEALAAVLFLAMSIGWCARGYAETAAPKP